ncbi:MAG: hypothetical protein KAU48_00175 [Candidatus Thorarchaeota archaeon]|nr:hypothetical protein [Candidatus Thorarchaeota archaeon]
MVLPNISLILSRSSSGNRGSRGSYSAESAELIKGLKEKHEPTDQIAELCGVRFNKHRGIGQVEGSSWKKEKIVQYV